MIVGDSMWNWRYFVIVHNIGDMEKEIWRDIDKRKGFLPQYILSGLYVEINILLKRTYCGKKKRRTGNNNYNVIILDGICFTELTGLTFINSYTHNYFVLNDLVLSYQYHW